MRIALVIPYFYPAWEYGGPPRVAHEVARALVRMGHSVDVLTTDTAGSSRLTAGQTNQAVDGITVRHYRNFSNYLAFRHRLFLPVGLLLRVRDDLADADIVHVHEFRSMLTVAAYSACRRLGKPYVLSPHGGLERLGKGRAKKLFDRLWGKAILDTADSIVALSPLEAKQARTLGIAGTRIRTVPNAVSIEDYDQLPAPGSFRQRWSLSESDIALFLGRLHRMKGADLLVRAFERVVKERPDTHLVVAGPDDGQEAEVRRLVGDLGLRNRVTFTGLLNHSAKLGAFVDATCIVVPSRNEIFSVTVVESLMCATPVLLSSACGLFPLPAPDEGVVQFTSGDVADLGRKLVYCLDDTSFQAGAAKGRQFAIREFGIEKVSARIEEMYLDILKRRTESRAAPI